MHTFLSLKKDASNLLLLLLKEAETLLPFHSSNYNFLNIPTEYSVTHQSCTSELDIMSSQDLTALESQNQSCNDQPAMHLNSMKRSWSTDSFSSNPNGKACVCSPTKHAGSFRCRLHRVSFNQQHAPPAPPAPHAKPSGSLEVVEAK
ncbi:hypothetical protein MRB53_001575 [Persea americana]|uniref:Uncharacterized protein n=1 Tax=Persea americana TaxID=3435 RepID=A0ACC2MS02_PERAE|nr:hypothetical protein MRB53_001575 [Persea americana]